MKILSIKLGADLSLNLVGFKIKGWKKLESSKFKKESTFGDISVLRRFRLKSPHKKTTLFSLLSFAKTDCK